MPSSRARREKRALKRIHETAQERQAVWLAGGNEALTGAQTEKLSRAYLDLRVERAEGVTPRPRMEGAAFYKGRPGGRD